MLAWTILITENIFLVFFLVIWFNRKCKKCGEVKCIERIFNRICQKCKEKPQDSKDLPKSRSKQKGTLEL